VIDLIVVLKIIILGVVEGVTEFLPISSTAHLILVSKIINFNEIKNNVFEIAIQLGAILAIVVIYFSKIFKIFIKYNSNIENRKFVNNIIIAFIPASIIGFISHESIKKYLFNNLTIALSLIIGGIIIIIIENYYDKLKNKSSNVINFYQALIIGLCQTLAMIPGISRSGSTIMGALALGIDRKTATEFSFFLAIPTIGGACLYDIYKNLYLLTFDDIEIIILGIFSSFIASLIIIKWLLKYISNHDFKIFGYYRIFVGFLILLFL
jgi:undecaprenyl-diphosphatase